MEEMLFKKGAGCKTGVSLPDSHPFVLQKLIFTKFYHQRDNVF